MKKRFMSIAALCIICLIAASCASQAPAANPVPASTENTQSAPAPSPAGETIRVVTYFAGSDAWAPVWQEVILEYMTANPGIIILDESQPTAGVNDMLKTKVQADLAANSPSDLMLYYTGDAYAETLTAQDSYLDFTEALSQDPEWAAGFKQTPLQSVQYQGKQYTLPYIGFYEGLFYNKSLFDKLGLAEPTSWENIINSLDALNENGITPLASSLAAPYFLVENFIMAQVGESNHRNYFDDSWAGALDAIAELHSKGAFPKDAMTLSEDDVRLLFSEGKAAMMINGSWCVDSLQSNPDMRIISMPTTPGGKGGSNSAISGFGSGWYMTKAAASRSGETLKLLKYLTSPEIMARFIAIGGSSAIYCEAPDSSSNLLKSAAVMLNTATYIDKTLDSQVGHEAYEAMNGGVQYIVEGMKTSKEVIEEARSLN
ncbi:MAG: extracellular solute-binding protein [Clostridiales bacterium]|nr:extracellular solute-binding protein [Clostridiales bacterium]